jgi:short-subunit dehydrogenase
VTLAARNSASLQADVSDLTIRHSVAVRAVEFDVLDTVSHVAFLDKCGETPQTVICFVGLLGDQSAAQHDCKAAELVMRTNYLGPVLVLGEVANRMEARGSGTIIGVSSVAGDRGRQSNYIYGSAKSGFTAFLSGLRNRLASKGVAVITIKPGFVATRMTEGMKLPPLLTAAPEEVAKAIAHAEAAGRDSVYVRPIWRWIMFCIRSLPERIFKRTKL